MTINDRRLLKEILRRDLRAFTVRAFQTVNPGTAYKDNWHITAIVHQLHESAAGGNPRVLITQPPRSMKSICASVAYPAWRLGHDPSLKIICASYSSDLARDFARQFRRVVQSDWYRDVFPHMRAKSDTDFSFVTTKGGGRVATSVGGTLTGRGGDIIILDDPMKAEDAVSETARRNCIDWYRNTVVTRHDDKTAGATIIVMQRLHEEDLAGYLLGHGGWTHLDLPAIAQERQTVSLGPDQVHVRAPGDLLHPEREPRDILDQIKAEIGSYNFSAQYLQRPVPLEGNLIKWGWFRYYAVPPAHNSDGRIVQSWDTALKAGDDNDFSVCTTWLMKGTDYYLLNVMREKLEYPGLKRRVFDMAHRFAAHNVLVEDTGTGTALIQDLKHARAGVRPIAMTPENDKVTRMSTVAPLIEAGQVILPEEAEWLDDFKNEVLAFPYGRHDDQVDSLSQFLKWAQERSRRRVRGGRQIGVY